MVLGLVDGLIRGSTLSWALIGGLWLIVMALVALRRGSVVWLFALLGVTTATSIAAMPLSSALAVPRLRWKTIVAPVIAASTGETWRRLRGPAVQVVGSDGLPDIAIPVLDASGQWVLFGLLGGTKVEGLPAAAFGKIELGRPRICLTVGEACRPWPVSWPDPSRPLHLGESVWVREGSADALAYDVELGVFLRGVSPPDEALAGGEKAVLELVGRLTTDPPREGTTALFVIRRFGGGRLSAVRVVSVPSNGTMTFHLQRASVDLALGRKVLRYVARPVLFVTAFALPAGVLVTVIAPFWLALRRRREGSAPASSGPASLVASRRTVSAWMGGTAGAIATLAAGLCMAAPAVVAIASLWAAR